MQLSEILVSIRHRLDEENADESHWSKSRLIDFADDGVREIALRLPPALLPALQQTTLRNLALYTTFYDLPTDWVRIYEILADYTADVGGTGAVNRKPMTLVDARYKHAFTHNVFYTPSTDNMFAIVFGAQVEINPTPSKVVQNGLEIQSIGIPAKMENDDDTPEIPLLAHGGIVTYAVYRALLEDGIDEHKTYFNEFEGKYPVAQGGITRPQ